MNLPSFFFSFWLSLFERSCCAAGHGRKSAWVAGGVARILKPGDVDERGFFAVVPATTCSATQQRSTSHTAASGASVLIACGSVCERETLQDQKTHVGEIYLGKWECGAHGQNCECGMYEKNWECDMYGGGMGDKMGDKAGECERTKSETCLHPCRIKAEKTGINGGHVTWSVEHIEPSWTKRGQSSSSSATEVSSPKTRRCAPYSVSVSSLVKSFWTKQESWRGAVHIGPHTW